MFPSDKCLPEHRPHVHVQLRSTFAQQHRLLYLRDMTIDKLKSTFCSRLYWQVSLYILILETLNSSTLSNDNIGL